MQKSANNEVPRVRSRPGSARIVPLLIVTCTLSAIPAEDSVGHLFDDQSTLWRSLRQLDTPVKRIEANALNVDRVASYPDRPEAGLHLRSAQGPAAGHQFPASSTLTTTYSGLPEPNIRAETSRTLKARASPGSTWRRCCCERSCLDAGGSRPPPVRTFVVGVTSRISVTWRGLPIASCGPFVMKNPAQFQSERVLSWRNRATVSETSTGKPGDYSRAEMCG